MMFRAAQILNVPLWDLEAREDCSYLVGRAWTMETATNLARNIESKKPKK
jgi:hypothetical protein